MLPNRQALLIISFISFSSNWQFGYQITYINTASTAFYNIANRLHQNELLQNLVKFKFNENNSNITDSTENIPYIEWSKRWSIIVSSFYPGTFIGFVVVPFLIRRVGVRQSLLFSSYPAILGCLLQLCISFFSNLGENAFTLTLAIGRCLVGIQAGCSLCLLPLFIIEASPVESRPFLSSLTVFQALSTLIGLFVGSIEFHEEIEWFQLFAILPMCAFILVLILLPDTPLHLFESTSDGDFFHDHDHSFQKKFYKSVAFYYGNLENIGKIRDEAYERWNIEMSNVNEGLLKNRANLKGLIVGSLAAISFSFTADDVIDSFSSQLLYRTSSQLNESEVHIEEYVDAITVSLGIWLLITSILGAFLINHFGRKRLLIIGLFGTAIANLIVSIGAAYNSVLTMTIGFIATKSFIGFGAGAPAWFLTSELVSPKVTCTAQSISTGFLLLTTGLVTLLFLPMESAVGVTWSFIFLATLPALLIAILLAMFLPETCDYSFDELRHQLGDHLFSGLAQFNFGRTSIKHLHTQTLSLPKYQRLMSASSYASYGSMRNLRHGSLMNANDDEICKIRSETMNL